jgi:hypothetical protein
LVEQRPLKSKVGGSIPPSPTTGVSPNGWATGFDTSVQIRIVCGRMHVWKQNDVQRASRQRISLTSISVKASLMDIRCGVESAKTMVTVNCMGLAQIDEQGYGRELISSVLFLETLSIR